MARYLTVSLVCIAVSLGLAQPAWATTNFIYPLSTWHVSTHQGEEISDGLFHMGVDAGYDLPAGTPVYAVADGIVREAQERTQFGLVVLIEHFPDDSSANVSLYGHLDPTDVRVTPGEQVSAGDVIGVLGTEENNGGWGVHLHFGIHKAAYTGDWVYYGHVRDAATAEGWYDPETYIPDHLVTDNWDPIIELDLADGEIVGNTLELSGSVGDIGSGLKKVRIKASSDGAAWETLALDEDPDYTLDNYLDISSYADGNFYLKIIARDQFNRKTVLVRSVTKDPYRYTTAGFIAMKGGDSDAFITQWSFGGTALNAFFPFKHHWNKGGLVTVSDVYGGSNNEIIAVRNQKKNTTPLVKILSASGDVRAHWSIPDITPQALTAGNGVIYLAQPLVGYDANATVVWSAVDWDEAHLVTDLAVDDTTLYVCWTNGERSRLSLIDLATGIVRHTFRPLRKAVTTGCQVTIGDFTGDGATELAIASNGDTAGTVRLMSMRGKPVGDSFRPFGDDFTGIIDVTAIQWDTVEDNITESELLVSQASAGQAWVKVYQLTNTPAVMMEDRVYEDTFTDGTFVVAWP
jgi:murein DD-endopeptidase MepM/ murein hydrolase activator NlpD